MTETVDIATTDPHEHMRRIALKEFQDRGGVPWWLGPLNVLLQILFVRLEGAIEWTGPSFSIGGTAVRTPEGRMTNIEATHVSLDGPGKYYIARWQILAWVVPLTGWQSHYKFLGSPKRWHVRTVRR